jgi:hypothetical protein
MHAHPPQWTHVRKPYPMSTSEGLSIRQIWRFSKSPLAPRCLWECRLPLNAQHRQILRKSQEKVRAPGFEPWWVASHWTVLPLDCCKISWFKINLILEILLATRNRYTSTTKSQEGSINPTHARNTIKEQIQTSACARRDAIRILIV